jgi:hypothetical protein
MYNDRVYILANRVVGDTYYTPTIYMRAHTYIEFQGMLRKLNPTASPQLAQKRNGDKLQSKE